MNYDDIKKLIDDMGNSKIDELKIEFPDGIKISMKKDLREPLEQNMTIKSKKESNQYVEEKAEEYKLIKSPMVGTFYSKSSPNAEPYVKIGDKVKKGDVLCVIEAMKSMNEIESEYDGEIVEISAKDEEMVEYGQVLFKIK